MGRVYDDRRWAGRVRLKPTVGEFVGPCDVEDYLGLDAVAFDNGAGCG